uniref:Uncharacterized protein n=1 Tax=Cuerna arida TaxID=1464854 RepID=A0A1B6GPJ9_9HEMI
MTTERRNMSNRNLLKLKQLLRQQEWDEIYYTDDTNAAYNKFNRILTQTLDQACPIIKTSYRKKKVFNLLNDNTASLLKQRFISAQNLYHATGREEHKRNAALSKKDYDLRLRHLRQQDTARKVAESDNKTKVLWNIINTERKSTRHRYCLQN